VIHTLRLQFHDVTVGHPRRVQLYIGYKSVRDTHTALEQQFQ